MTTRRTVVFKTETTSYRISQLGSEAALGLVFHLGVIFGGALGAVFSENTGEGEAKVRAAVTAVFSANFDEAQSKRQSLRVLCDALGASTTELRPLRNAEGGKVADAELPVTNWDDHFAGRLADLLLWIWEGVKLNWSDFFAVAGISLESLPQAAKLQNTSAK